MEGREEPTRWCEESAEEDVKKVLKWVLTL